ncbi:uncharacterized protein LOC6523849 [Drosophila yakuba]|uniref:Uncharacterized protein n=1 Tax=Drosophila yakuba TaxID=7245 RepID=B4PX44_DROYA|nr:uncharacterized protein LOC6523849 [Drosophila yakuba]EDX00830.1 uncharacterized protein Dyak_GE16643 [Drosophila yakuba]
MCSSLSDLFACIRAQGNCEADSTSPTHQRNNADLDDEAPGLQLKQEQSRRRIDPVPAPPTGSPSPSTGYLRPSLRPARVSYEALERYDRIYGRSFQEAGSTGSVRNIADQF